MENMKGTKTNTNIIFVFYHKSQIINMYSFFSIKAKKEGFLQISDFFSKIADQEKEHSKILLNLFEDDKINLSSDVLVSSGGSTLENLKLSMKIERRKYIDIFPVFSEVAKKEGFIKVSSVFELMSKVERQHEKGYRNLVLNIESGSFFRRDTFVLWRCRTCGYTFNGKEAPNCCPLCFCSKIFFEVFSKF